MSKDIYNNSTFLGKSLYNIQPSGQVNKSALNSYLNSFIGSGDTSGDSANQIFGIVTADIVNTNIISSLQEISVGSGGLLRIVPIDQQIINDAFTYGVMVTTNLYSQQADKALGYTSIKLDVPYVYNTPDHVLISQNKEAPDNFLEISNSKFRVTGPFTNIKSTKTAFKSPTITLGYYDREESSFAGATTLDFKTYDKGIVMERVESDAKTVDGIKFSYIGYSQNLGTNGRFVLYNDGKYTGTETYSYPKMDGTPSRETGVLTEYQISRNPSTIGTSEGTSVLEVDTIYTNNIIAADHTNSRKLNLHAYDTMTIGVNRAPGDTDPNKSFDLLLDVAGKIIVSSSGSSGTIQTSQNDYRIQSETGTFINAYNPDEPTYSSVPVYIGYNSLVDVNNWLRTTYISTGVTTRNADTMVEIGGNFIASDGIGAGSKLLIDGSITGDTNNDIHGIYSNPTINVPTNNSTNYVSNVTLQPATLNIGSGSSVNTSSTLHVIGATTNATHNYSILSSAGDVKFLGLQTTGASMTWSNDSLNLYNARLYVNSETSDLPVLSFGEPGSEINIFTIKRMEVDGSNELFLDGVGSRIQLADNRTYSVTGTITASQGNAVASFEIKYCLSINNGIKTQKWYTLNEIYCDIDVTDQRIFDVIVGYSGDATLFTNGDGLTITGTNINNTNTNWYGILEITALEKP